MTETQPQAPVQQPSRWLKPLLIASLALNLIVIGGAAGAFFKHRHGGGHARGLTGFVKKLPAGRQPELMALVKAEREKIKPIREEIRANWDETNTALAAEPFDKDRLKAAMAKLIEAEMRMRTLVGDAIVTTAEKLSPGERQQMKAWRQRHHDRLRKKWKRKWDEDGD